MRLPLLPPNSLTAAQQDLYGDMRDVIDSGFGELVAYRGDGALIGPFNGWLHFPQFGSPAWAFNRSLWEHALLPGSIHQLVILVTAAKFGARYEIYGHEYFAHRAGLSEDKIATITAGERPADLTDEERVAYDVAGRAQPRRGPSGDHLSSRRSTIRCTGACGDRVSRGLLLDGRRDTERVRRRRTRPRGSITADRRCTTV